MYILNLLLGVILCYYPENKTKMNSTPANENLAFQDTLFHCVRLTSFFSFQSRSKCLPNTEQSAHYGEELTSVQLNLHVDQQKLINEFLHTRTTSAQRIGTTSNNPIRRNYQSPILTPSRLTKDCLLSQTNCQQPQLTPIYMNTMANAMSLSTMEAISRDYEPQIFVAASRRTAGEELNTPVNGMLIYSNFLFEFFKCMI